MPSAADGAPDDDFDDDHEGGDHDERLDGGDGDSEGPRVLDDGHDSDASVEGNTEDFQDGYREARAQWAWTRADVDALFRRGEEAGWHQILVRLSWISAMSLLVCVHGYAWWRRGDASLCGA